MGKKKDHNGFTEHYTVKFTYPMENGYWTTEEADIGVRCAHGEREKDNHAAAEAAVLVQHPKARIISVKYQ